MTPDALAKPSYSSLPYFWRRHKIFFVAILVLTLVSSVLESISVVAFFPIFASLFGTSEDGEGGILGLITRTSEKLPFANPIIAASVLLVTVFIAKTALVLVRELVTAYAGAKIFYDVKKHVMARYTAAQYQFILDNQQGTLLYNVLDAPDAVSALLFAAVRMATGLMKVIAIVVVLVAIIPLGAISVAGFGLVYYAGMHYLSKTVSFRIGTKKAAASSEQIVVTNEFFSGFRQIVSLNATRWWLEEFDRGNRVLSEQIGKEMAWNALPRPIMEFSALGLMLGLVLVIWLSSPDSIVESMPTVGVFAVALAQLMPPLTSIAALRMRLMGLLPNMEIAYQAMTGPVPQRNEGLVELDAFQNAIVFEDVSFGYPSREPLFEGLNLTFRKGEVTALVGTSGAGKTTIVNLILGLFGPTKGRITVDGIDLNDIKHTSWLNKIGLVSQEPFTYHSTITNNILIGRNGASQETVVNAAEIANAHEFISELPDGYETIVGERGMKFSGGQQQRIAIARALLDRPDIMIFDEATSSLDTISERYVQESINHISKDRTVIIIAHRLSTIRHADKIIVLDQGRVVEIGNHEDLLVQNGHYARLAGAVG